MDGLPVVSEIAVGDQFIHLDDGVFTLGSGDTGPVVGALNRKLAALDYLGFTDPQDDTYGEPILKAVANFHLSQGLPGSGVLDAQTWVLLDNPQPPGPRLFHPSPRQSSVSIHPG